MLIPTYGRAELLPRVVAAWAQLAPDSAAPAGGRPGGQPARWSACTSAGTGAGQTGHRSDPQFDYQIVVVDDGSPDDASAVLAQLQHSHPDLLTVVRQENRGRAAARNAAIAAARGELLLFSDDDMVPDSKDLLQRHLDAQARQPGAWVSHLQVPDECARTPFQAYWRRRLHAGTAALSDGQDLGYGGFWFATLSLPRALLGSARFDETFRGYGWEEHEMGYRLFRAGVRARFLRAAYIQHHDPVALRSSFEKYVAMGRAAWTFSGIHRNALVAYWTGTNLLSRAWRRLARLEARAQKLMDSGQEQLTDRQYHLVLEGAYSRGLREGRARHA